MDKEKRNVYLDCKVKINSLIIFLKYRRYPKASNILLDENITDRKLYEKALYFEACHLASEVIEKLLQLLSITNIKNKSHSLIIYYENANISKENKDKMTHLIHKNDNCFVETRYPDYYKEICDKYDLNELLEIINILLKEANNLGFVFEETFNDCENYGIYNLNDSILYAKFLDYLIDKYTLNKLYESIISSYDNFDDQNINAEFDRKKISKEIIISLIIDKKYENSDVDRKISGTLIQKYAYRDACAKYYTLHWYLENIDRIVYGESGENPTYLETNLEMNFINKKSQDNDIMQNYIYYNACHLAAEAIEKMFKSILLYNGIDYEQLKGNFGHSFVSMFDMMTTAQKQLMYNEALSIYNPMHIKGLGTKPNKPDKPLKRMNSNDLEHLYTFDKEDMSDETIANAVKLIDESKEWNEKGKNLFILQKRIGEMYLKKVLEIMDKAFIETRYPEQFSINFNYKYNLNYLLEILKALEHMSRIIFEIWRYKNDDMDDYEMTIAKEAHPELLFEESGYKSAMGNSKFHIVDNDKIY